MSRIERKGIVDGHGFSWFKDLGNYPPQEWLEDNPFLLEQSRPVFEGRLLLVLASVFVEFTHQESPTPFLELLGSDCKNMSNIFPSGEFNGDFTFSCFFWGGGG